MRTIGADHLNKLGVTRKNHFELLVPAFDLTLAVKTCPIPKTVTEQLELSYGNETVFLAGKTKADGTWDVVFRELVKADVVGTLQVWRRAVYNEETRSMGDPSDYKQNGFVIRYNPDGTIRDKIQVEGVFPLSIDLGEGDYEAGDPVECTVSFSFDRAIRTGLVDLVASSIQA